MKQGIGLVPKETILIAGHVLNKCKNEFDITGAPQEIAGFFIPSGSLKGGPGKIKQFEIIYVIGNILNL